jgi:hypothetical protein
MQSLEKSKCSEDNGTQADVVGGKVLRLYDNH